MLVQFANDCYDMPQYQRRRTGLGCHSQHTGQAISCAGPGQDRRVLTRRQLARPHTPAIWGGSFTQSRYGCLFRGSTSSSGSTDLLQCFAGDIRPWFWDVLAHPPDGFLRALFPELAELPQHHLADIRTYGVSTLEDVFDEVLEQVQEMQAYLLRVWRRNPHLPVVVRSVAGMPRDWSYRNGVAVGPSMRMVGAVRPEWIRDRNVPDLAVVLAVSMRIEAALATIPPVEPAGTAAVR